MFKPFITSKKGHLECISIYIYEFSESIKKQQNQLNKFIKWLKYSDSIFTYEINSNGFKTFSKMPEESSWQYTFKSSIETNPPFNNTQQISSYISSLIRDSFNKKYTRFLNSNVFITSQLELKPFILQKGIEFNVEVFTSGDVYLNFIPVSKIVSPENVDLIYLKLLKSKFENEDDSLEISLIEQSRFKRKKIRITDKDAINKAISFIEDNESVVATFNYHFVSSYSSDIFVNIVNETIKDIDKSIFYLQENLELIRFSTMLNFQKKTFYGVKINSLGSENNLVIGDNKIVNRQGAAFYNGIFTKAENSIIQPILVDKYPEIDSFFELIERFNKGAENFQILDPIRVSSIDTNIHKLITETKRKYNAQKYLAAIFTNYKQPSEFISQFKFKKILFQIYLGSIDNFKLSNFSVKCLEKLGGLLSIIHNTNENEDTYFVGIDLGHSTNQTKAFSNLAVVFYDHKGKFMYSAVKKNLPRNESISSESICSCFASFKNYLKISNRKLPKKLIIHRDGKLHKIDGESIIEQSRNQLSCENVDIVEIIKHGFPVFACFEAGAYINLKSGDYYLDKKNKYAILITNIQADEKNAIVNPLIIKHKIGETDINIIIKQIYWFTRVYTNNLFNSTRLPATTLKANNIVSTSSKKHFATYKG